jgi:hypothetical protein
VTHLFIGRYGYDRAMRVGVVLCVVLGLTGCPPTTTPPACVNDCDAGGSGGGAGGGSGGGMGGGSTVDAGCLESWTCAAWEISDAGTAARTCSDLSGCGTTEKRPALGPAALPLLDLPYFKCEVQPVLERGCGMLGCHGTLTDRSFRLFSRGRLRNSEQVPQVAGCVGGTLDLAAEGTGTITCVGRSPLTDTEWARNFDGARAFAIGVPDAGDTELLTQPLQGNARVHAGVKLLSLNDASYLKLKSWLSGATAPSGCDAGFN